MPFITSSKANFADNAAFETTSRLVAGLINEGLVAVTFGSSNGVCCLVLRSHNELVTDSTQIVVSLCQGTRYEPSSATNAIADEDSVSAISPELNKSDIVGPITIQYSDQREKAVYRPEEVLDVAGPWICDNQQVLDQMRGELQDSADNQEKWLRYALSRSPPVIGSPLIDWEQHLIQGHPIHPMHRAFYAIPPVKPVQIDDIEKFLDVEIIILSVPRERVHLNGSFEAILKPLLRKLNLPSIPASRVLLPCHAEQLPVILDSLGTEAVVVSSRNKNIKLRGQRQASLRSTSIPDFPFHVKMDLNYVITGSKRSISPWAISSCVEISQLLHEIATDPEIMPDTNLLWVARTVATVSSPDANLSVILREDHEPRARKLGQCLVLPGTLFEVDSKDNVSHVVKLFGLNTLDARKTWFRNYTRVFLKAVLPPLLSHGIGLEAHMQNTILRFEIGTNIPCGFVYRDMGGLRLHVPTLARRGVTITSAAGMLLTEDIDAVRVNAHHSIVAGHLGGALQAMGLAWEGGWDIVREEMITVLNSIPHSHIEAAELSKFMFQPQVMRKAFLTMKFSGIPNRRFYFWIPNPLVTQVNH